MCYSIENEHTKSEAHLRQIAEILGFPMEHFFYADDSWSDNLEIFRFWSAIRSDEDRVLALECLKSIVSNQDRCNG